MIFKIHRYRGEFTTLSNAPYEDPRLSFKAKGVLAYLLTRKKDWIVQVQDLVNRSQNGRDSIYTALRELRECGYATLEEERDRGRVVKKFWAIHEKPITGKPITGNPYTENPDISKYEVKQKLKGISARRKAPAELPSFGVNSDTTKEHQGAPVLATKYLEFAIKHKFHLGRNWYPTQTTSKAEQRRARTRRQWLRAANVLLERLNGNFHQAKAVMRWYFTHHKDDWVPTCLTLITFVEDFVKIEKAMQRANKQQEKAKPKIEKISSDPYAVFKDLDEDGYTK